MTGWTALRHDDRRAEDDLEAYLPVTVEYREVPHLGLAAYALFIIIPSFLRVLIHGRLEFVGYSAPG